MSTPQKLVVETEKKNYIYFRFKDSNYNKDIKFISNRFTPAVADKVLPLYELLFEFRKKNTDLENVEGMEYSDGQVVNANFKKLMEFNLQSMKPLTVAENQEYNFICQDIIKAIIKYDKTNDIYKDEIESNTDSEFWYNQDQNDFREFVEFFRTENKLRI